MLIDLPTPVSEETVRVLEELLEEARSGRVRGIAFVALEARGAYTAHATGLAALDPTRTRGTLFALAAKLEQIMLARCT